MRPLIACALVLIGCASVPRVVVPEVLPQLVEQEPLPPPSAVIRASELKLDLSMLIAADGSVAEVAILTPTDDPVWNEEARKRIKRWKFSPALLDHKPVPLWIRQSVRVRFQEPLVMHLAEIVCSTREKADSIFALLRSGESFDSIASRVLQEGKLRTGVMDVRRFPSEVQAEVVKLKVHDFSGPLRLGGNYVIFRRLGGEARVQP